MSVLFAATYPDRTAALVLRSPFAEPCGRRTIRGVEPRTNTSARSSVSFVSTGRGAGAGVDSIARPVRDDELRGIPRLPPLRRQSRNARGAPADEQGDRHPRRAVGGARADTDPPRRGRRDRAARRGSVSRRPDPGRELVELPGVGHLALGGATDRINTETRRFLTDVWDSGGWDDAEPDRMLATVLFTDIVDATGKALELGDRAWRELLERHHSIVRRELIRFRGREIDTSGDGFFAAFDGPARAIRCACAVVDRVRELGSMSVRACTRVSARSRTARSQESPCTRALASRRLRKEARSSFEHCQGSRRGLRDPLRGPGPSRAERHPRRVAIVRNRARIHLGRFRLLR